MDESRKLDFAWRTEYLNTMLAKKINKYNNDNFIISIFIQYFKYINIKIVTKISYFMKDTQTDF